MASGDGRAAPLGGHAFVLPLTQLELRSACLTWCEVLNFGGFEFDGASEAPLAGRRHVVWGVYELGRRYQSVGVGVSGKVSRPGCGSAGERKSCGLLGEWSAVRGFVYIPF